MVQVIKEPTFENRNLVHRGRYSPDNNSIDKERKLENQKKNLFLVVPISISPKFSCYSSSTHGVSDTVWTWKICLAASQCVNTPHSQGRLMELTIELSKECLNGDEKNGIFINSLIRLFSQLTY